MEEKEDIKKTLFIISKKCRLKIFNSNNDKASK